MLFFKKNKRLEISNHITAIDGRVVARKGDVINQKYVEQLYNIKPPGTEHTQLFGETYHFTNIEILLKELKYQFISHDSQKKTQLSKNLAGISLNEINFNELTWMERYKYHYDHVLAVTILVAAMTLDCYQDEDKARKAASCALTHDFGITRVPEQILTKVSPLEDDEMKIVREHPIYSYILLTYYGFAPSHLNTRVGFQHHENLLGTGYPCSIIQENEIAQFVQISDIFDALISARPFRPALSAEKAVLTIAEMVAKGQVDTEVFALLKSSVRA